MIRVTYLLEKRTDARPVLDFVLKMLDVRMYVPLRVDCCSFAARSDNSPCSVKIAIDDCCNDYGTADSHKTM